MLKYRIITYRKKWNKTINNAFASTEVHIFSVCFIQHRELIQNNSLGRKKDSHFNKYKNVFEKAVYIICIITNITL